MVGRPLWEEIAQREPHGTDDVDGSASCEIVDQDSAILELADRQGRTAVLVGRAFRDPPPRPCLPNGREAVKQLLGAHAATAQVRWITARSAR